MQYIGPIFIVSVVIGIFVFISYLLSKRNLILSFLPSAFLFVISTILIINAYFVETEAFGDVISLILGLFFAVCFVVTLVFTFFFNRSSIKKRIK